MTFAALPDVRAGADPDGPAVADATVSLSNAGLLQRVRAAADHLRGLGIGADDVVAVMLRNRVEFVVLLFACWRLSATVTPVNPSLTDAEVVRQLEASSARLLITEDGAPTPDTVNTLAVDDLRQEALGSDPLPLVEPSTMALLIFTSGTTGVPKGVMLDHANLAAMSEMGRQALGIEAADRCLLILPLFHVNGIVVSVLMPLLADASVVITERFDAATFFGVVEAQQPTYFSAVPTIYTLLAALPDDVRPDMSSVRFGICGAAPASTDLLGRFESRYGFPLIEGYGLSEATCASTINPIVGERRAGTVGIAFPGQQIRIIDDDGAEAPTGTDGEVIVAGPNVMRGYLGRPDETARVLVDGWLHTGDIGHLDADGYLTLVGRSKDMIIRGGENIYPKEIEDVLSSDPTVLEAAVIGVPDDKWGETVAAYVAPRPGRTVDTAALHALCARTLAGYKRPTSITVVDAIPKNAIGKADKAPLRAAHLTATLV
ncbi:MAG TPA: AMP-binding protein [Mycobacterium sp.]